jgi:hypothetical protein
MGIKSAMMSCSVHGQVGVCCIAHQCKLCGGKGCSACNYSGWVKTFHTCPKCGIRLISKEY